MKFVTMLYFVCLLSSCGGQANQKAPTAVEASIEKPTTMPDKIKEATTQPAVAVFDPPAPNGIPLPRGVRIVRQDLQEPRSAYTWAAVVKGDRSHPDIIAFQKLKQSTEGVKLDASTAAIQLYFNDVDAFGPAWLFGTLAFDFTTPKWSVMIRVPESDGQGGFGDGLATSDEDGPYFTVIVATIGG